MYEVELRGSLNKQEYSNLKHFLQENGNFVSHLKRFLIRFSTKGEDIPSFDESLDVRLRVTNGKLEIITKQGDFAAQYREESSIFLQAGQFEEALKCLSLLGYKKGIGAYRIIERYMYRDVEFSLVTVPGYAYFYEAEKLVENNPDKSAETIKALLKTMELKVFEENEFKSFIEDLDHNANILFDYATYKSGDIDDVWLV